MATIVTRAGKGSALTFVEGDANFTNLNTDKIELTSLSVGSPATASGSGSLAYNNTTGVFTFTPPVIPSAGISNVVEDSTPQLGGDLDVLTRSITTSTTNGNIVLTANGTGSIELASEVSFNTNRLSYGTGASHGVTFNSDGMVSLGYIKSFGENIYVSTTTTGTWAPNAADAPLQYVAMTGNMTVNGFTSGTGGQTITIIFDGTGGSYTLTLGADILTPGGTGGLTAGGMDLVTITLIDDETPVYIATIVNDFQ